MNTCENYAALLDMYVDGFCTEEETEQVRRHLADCESCRQYVEQLLQIREAFPDAEETEVPAGFAAGVMARIRAESAPRKKQMKAWQKTLLQMAACIALVIALGPLSQRLTGTGADSMAEMAKGGAAYAPQSTATYAATATESSASAVYDAVHDDAEAKADSTVSESANGAASEPPSGAAPGRTAEVKLTRQQIKELLAGYQGEEKSGGIAYVLTAEEFDAVLAKLPADAMTAGSASGSQGDGSACLLTVYPTE